MPLPFLKKKQVAGLIISHRHPSGNINESEPEKSDDTGIEACCSDLISAFKAEDPVAMAAAIRAIFDIGTSPSQDDNSFDTLNAKAAEGQE